MRAVVCEKLGDPTLPLGAGVLRLAEDVPSPEAKPGCIKVRVTAASLNFPDALQIKVGNELSCMYNSSRVEKELSNPSCIHPPTGIFSACNVTIIVVTYASRHTATAQQQGVCLLLQGQYQVKPPLPFIPGNEVSGIVVQVRSHASCRISSIYLGYNTIVACNW